MPSRETFKPPSYGEPEVSQLGQLVEEVKLCQIGPAPFRITYFIAGLCLSKLEHAIKVIANVLTARVGKRKRITLE